MHLGVDFFGSCAILFSVMRDRIEIEEIFEADPQARAEFDTVCDEWQNDAIEAQEAELAERKRKANAEMFWFIFNRRQQGDWG